MCVSLWNKLLKLLLSICFTCFQSINCIQLQKLPLCKRATECLSLVKSQHVYFASLWCGLRVRLCTHASFDESSRGGVFTSIWGRVHRRCLIVKSWSQSVACGESMGFCWSLICSAAAYLFLASPARHNKCKLDLKVTTVICYSNYSFILLFRLVWIHIHLCWHCVY